MPIMFSPGACCCKTVMPTTCLYSGDITDEVIETYCDRDHRYGRDIPVITLEQGFNQRTIVPPADFPGDFFVDGCSEILPCGHDNAGRWIYNIQSTVTALDFDNAIGQINPASTATYNNQVYQCAYFLSVIGVTKELRIQGVSVPINLRTGKVDQTLRNYLKQFNWIGGVILTFHKGHLSDNSCHYSFCRCRLGTDAGIEYRNYEWVVPFGVQINDLDELFTLLSSGITDVDKWGEKSVVFSNSSTILTAGGQYDSYYLYHPYHWNSTQRNPFFESTTNTQMTKEESDAFFANRLWTTQLFNANNFPIYYGVIRCAKYLAAPTGMGGQAIVPDITSYERIQTCANEINTLQAPVFGSEPTLNGSQCRYATPTAKPWGKSCFACTVTECRAPKRPPITDLVAAHLRYPVNADGSENRESDHYEVRSKYCNPKCCSLYEE